MFVTISELKRIVGFKVETVPDELENIGEIEFYFAPIEEMGIGLSAATANGRFGYIDTDDQSTAEIPHSERVYRFEFPLTEAAIEFVSQNTVKASIEYISKRNFKVMPSSLLTLLAHEMGHLLNQIKMPTSVVKRGFSDHGIKNIHLEDLPRSMNQPGFLLGKLNGVPVSTVRHLLGDSFEEFIDRFPKWGDKITFKDISEPLQDPVKEHKRRQEIKRWYEFYVAAINGEFE